MKFLKQVYTYIRRHLDFLILDLVTYALAYVISVVIRRSMDIEITHGELFLKYGVVSIVIFLIIEIITKNLNGVVSRTAAREFQAVGLQMISTWSIYTMILYLLKSAYHFSRAIYITTFFVCLICLFLARTILKLIVRYSKFQNKLLTRMIVICDAKTAGETVKRVLPGCLENQYDICAVIVDGEEETDYHWGFPCVKGLDNIRQFLVDKRVQTAYIELGNVEKETAATKMLLDEGIIVHCSLGNRRFNFATQRINDLSGRSVITIEDTRVSLVSKIERFTHNSLKKLRKKQR